MIQSEHILTTESKQKSICNLSSITVPNDLK